MSFQIPLFLYVVLMSSLALMVRWESVRRRKGPRLKPGVLDRQLARWRETSWEQQTTIRRNRR